MSATELKTAIRYYTRMAEDAELADWQRKQASAMLVRLSGEG